MLENRVPEFRELPAVEANLRRWRDQVGEGTKRGWRTKQDETKYWVLVIVRPARRIRSLSEGRRGLSDSR